MHCQGVTLVPIYRHPTEKFVKRGTYTHAGAEKECKTHNLTLAKEVQPTHYITGCLYRFGQNVLTTTNLKGQQILYWLGDGNLFWSQHGRAQFHPMDDKSFKRSSSFALCEKGKTQLILCVVYELVLFTQFSQ